MTKLSDVENHAYMYVSFAFHNIIRESMHATVVCVDAWISEKKFVHVVFS